MPTPTPTPTETYSYIISVSGSNYQMTDGTTEQMVFQSTNSSQVFSNVVGNCSVGSSIDVESGVYAVNTVWTMMNVNNLTLNFEEGATLFAGNNLDSPVLFLNNTNNCLLTGVNINGNSANQATESYPYWSSGLLIFGSNDQVSNAYIYDCRVMGVEIAVGGNVSSSSADKVVNSTIFGCGWNGIGIGNPNIVNTIISNNDISGCSDVGISTYGTGTQIIGNYVHDLNGTIGGGGNAEWGIAVEGGSNATITQNTVQNCSIGIEDSGMDYCVISNNLVVGASQARPQYGIVLSDGYGTNGCYYNSVTDNNVTGIYCNTTLYLGGIGIFLQGATFNFVGGNYVSQCGSDGIYLDSPSNNNNVTQNTFSDQTVGQYYTMAIGGSGIEIAGTSNYISQNQAFDDRSGSSRTQQYGLALDLGAANNNLTGNNVYGNVVAQIYDVNVPENMMVSNVGYNPVGSIVKPISGNTAYLVDSGSNSTWISGKVYTNSGSPKELIITGGTVSAVAKNGVTLFTATGCTVTLQPEDTFSITFSQAPTISVSGE